MNKTNDYSMTFGVAGTGAYLPSRIVSASELDRMMGRAEGWTARHAGVLERRWVEEETQSEMGAMAAKQALAEEGIELREVDTLICASGTPEQPIPCTAARILGAMDNSASHLAAYDINATCLSFLVAFDHAAQLISTGRSRCVLLVSSEIASAGIDFTDAESAALMGDGAAAVVLRREAGAGKVLAFKMRTFPEGLELAELKGGGSLYHPKRRAFRLEDYLFRMKGKQLFKLVSQRLGAQVSSLMREQGLSWKDIKAVVPHQASGPAVDLLGKRLGIPEEKLLRIYPKVGNTIAASIPMALHELRQKTPLQRGDKLLLVGTSAGVSIASLLIEI